VIYPDSVGEMAGKGWRDEDLLEVLHTVHLAHILAREGGWDTAADWKVIQHTLLTKFGRIFLIYGEILDQVQSHIEGMVSKVLGNAPKLSHI